MERTVRWTMNNEVGAPVAVIIGSDIGSFDLPAYLAAGKIRGVNIDIPPTRAHIGDLRGCRGKRQRTDGAGCPAGKSKVETNWTVDTDRCAIVNVGSDYIGG